jgi:hypothetical protein
MGKNGIIACPLGLSHICRKTTQVVKKLANLIRANKKINING